MGAIFRDRTEAGRLLAERLSPYVGRDEVLVLGLPRGGVPVAFEIARRLRARLDVFVVRKLGVPRHEEFAFGAIATGGVRVLDREVIDSLAIPPQIIHETIAREERELKRRELAYRGHEVAAQVHGSVTLLVDDGIATGSTMTAALRALRLQQPARLVIAVPTAAPSSCEKLAKEADEVISLVTPRDFVAVGQWYMDFGQTSDEEVRRLLNEAGTRTARSGRELP